MAIGVRNPDGAGRDAEKLVENQRRYYARHRRRLRLRRILQRGTAWPWKLGTYTLSVWHVGDLVAVLISPQEVREPWRLAAARRSAAARMLRERLDAGYVPRRDKSYSNKSLVYGQRTMTGLRRVMLDAGLLVPVYGALRRDRVKCVEGAGCNDSEGRIRDRA